ncbi:MAG: response regulator [Actinomycetota bacterium]|nr:response regulator [Actinomycetota bacterium]
MRKKTILLIEDDKEDLAFAMNAFKTNQAFLNYLIIAYNGQEAMKLLMLDENEQKIKPSFFPDLIILDLKLPIIGGLEVLKKIKKSNILKNIPVVIFTSSNKTEDLLESYNLGANSFVKKPIIFEEFISTLAKIVDYWLEVNITVETNY